MGHPASDGYQQPSDMISIPKSFCFNDREKRNGDTVENASLYYHSEDAINSSDKYFHRKPLVYGTVWYVWLSLGVSQQYVPKTNRSIANCGFNEPTCPAPKEFGGARKSPRSNTNEPPRERR